MDESGGWIDLRAPGGRLLARYDPARQLLEFRRGRDAWIVDLRRPSSLGVAALPASSPDVAVEDPHVTDQAGNHAGQ